MTATETASVCKLCGWFMYSENDFEYAHCIDCGVYYTDYGMQCLDCDQPVEHFYYDTYDDYVCDCAA